MCLYFPSSRIKNSNIKLLFSSERTHNDASFALKMIKRAPSLGLTVVEISWAERKASRGEESGGYAPT